MAIAMPPTPLVQHRQMTGSPVGEISRGILEGCQRKAPNALREFVLHYQQLVFAFLSRMLGHGPHVEDLAQEVFLRACRGLSTFELDGPARVSTWLLTIASRIAIDWRRTGRHRTIPIDQVADRADTTTPETGARRAEIVRAFESAAAQLDEDQRMVFVLAEFHGLTMLEIAHMLNIPENTAKTRLFRARERLRSALAHLREE